MTEGNTICSAVSVLCSSGARCQVTAEQCADMIRAADVARKGYVDFPQFKETRAVPDAAPPPFPGEGRRALAAMRR